MPCSPSSFLVTGCDRWWTSTTHMPPGLAPSAPSGETCNAGTASRGVGSYVRVGFSPVLSESRWICSRVTVPIARITKSSRMCYIGPRSWLPLHAAGRDAWTTLPTIRPEAHLGPDRRHVRDARGNCPPDDRYRGDHVDVRRAR